MIIINRDQICAGSIAANIYYCLVPDNYISGTNAACVIDINLNISYCQSGSGLNPHPARSGYKIACHLHHIDGW